ncbi:hypothetical protein, partial [Kingella kingae]|uniref:hypothetical protein n=1 Tax=Kingella kingae TaxID=504 RepID=UPI001E386E59
VDDRLLGRRLIDNHQKQVACPAINATAFTITDIFPNGSGTRPLTANIGISPQAYFQAAPAAYSR